MASFEIERLPDVTGGAFIKKIKMMDDGPMEMRPTQGTRYEAKEAIPPERASAMKSALTQEQRTLQGAGLARMLGALGAAVSAKEPTSWQHQLGLQAERLGRADQMQALREGKKLPGVAGFGITDQDRAQLLGEAMAGEELGLKRKQVGAMETQARKMETPGERRAREVEVARIRSAGSGTGQLQFKSGVPMEGGQVGNLVFDPMSGRLLDTGMRAERFKPNVPSIPNIPEPTRQNYMAAVFSQIQELMGKTKREGFLGFPGKIEKEDVEEYLLKRGEWSRTKPTKKRELDIYNKMQSPQIQPLLEAYDVLLNRLDIGARATDADEALKQRVIKALGGIGVEGGGQELPQRRKVEY